MRPEPRKQLILTRTTVKIDGFRENKAAVCLELESSSRSGMQLCGLKTKVISKIRN